MFCLLFGGKTGGLFSKWRRPIWRHVVLTLLAATTSVKCQFEEWSEENDELVPTIDVEAVVGRSALFPCNIDPETNEDRVYMVLWFKSTSGKPLYRTSTVRLQPYETDDPVDYTTSPKSVEYPEFSEADYKTEMAPNIIDYYEYPFDVRGRGFNKALHWSDPDVFGPRAYLFTMSQPASLKVDSISLADEGVYRCRVDFKNSPTRNCKVRLSVIVPPKELVLSDQDGLEISGKIGPLEEGSNLLLICNIYGGRPQPTINWYVNGEAVSPDSQIHPDSQTTVSTFRLSSIDRSWLNTTIRCQANNTRLLSPYEKTARIEMNLRPLSIAILKKPSKMYADEELTLECVVHGSRPPARIFWYRNEEKYTRGKLTEHITTTSSRSVLKLAPLPDDHGTTLKCLADNPALTDSTVEDNFTMNVMYRPQVSLKLGSTLNPGEIREGDDVYLECVVKANPKEHRVTWFHDEKTVAQNISAGVIISGHSLVMQKVSKGQAGHYSCNVANSIGDTTSQLVKLRVQFVPICALPSPLVIGGRLEATISVRCVVSGDPSDVTFVWLFNNSGESFQVSSERYVSSGVTSVLQFKASNEREYGTLVCKAKNAVGVQRKPCVFQILPAARPSPPHNCAINSTSYAIAETMTVKCQPGYDGGLTQHFLLEAKADEERILLANATANYSDDSVVLDIPVRNIPRPKNVDLVVYAKNLKGYSDPVFLDGIEISGMEEFMPESVQKSPQQFSLSILFVVALATLAVSLAALLFIIKRRNIRSTTTQSKRPTLTVVQVDGTGRNYVVAYPDKPEKHKPDIISAKPERCSSRVVLESSESTRSPTSIEDGAPLNGIIHGVSSHEIHSR